MKEVIEKMTSKKEGKKADKKAAKLSTLKALSDSMSEMMGGNLKKVTVAAKTNKGLKAGLEKAEDLMEKNSKDKDDE